MTNLKTRDGLGEVVAFIEQRGLLQTPHPAAARDWEAAARRRSVPAAAETNCSPGSAAWRRRVGAPWCASRNARLPVLDW